MNAKLIQRLRDKPTAKELKNGLDPITTKIWNELLFEAADEIERQSRLLDKIANKP